MCSNNYVPHSYGEKICRVFILVDEEHDEFRRFQINLAQFLEGADVNMASVFELMAQKGLDIEGKRFNIPSLGLYYEQGKNNLWVPLSDVSERKIEVVQESQQESHTESQSEDQGNKKQKQPEGVIRTVLERVKLWRHMHSGPNRISLTQAAKHIGISKKTLDDYFLQLRLGQLYGFDFKNNLDERIGVLRAHIRKHEAKELQANLPKLIKSFQLVRDVEELKCDMPGEPPCALPEREQPEPLITFADLI